MTDWSVAWLENNTKGSSQLPQWKTSPLNWFHLVSESILWIEGQPLRRDHVVDCMKVWSIYHRLFPHSTWGHWQGWLHAGKRGIPRYGGTGVWGLGTNAPSWSLNLGNFHHTSPILISFDFLTFRPLFISWPTFPRQLLGKNKKQKDTYFTLLGETECWSVRNWSLSLTSLSWPGQSDLLLNVELKRDFRFSFF